MATIADEKYLLPRDESESVRLDLQHQLFVGAISGLKGNPIHPSIPVTSLSSIADVATGTACWLEDTRKYFQRELPTPSRYYKGFDISAAQFPRTTNLDLSVHDLLQPFPSEHRNRYDLVHVRLLVAVLGIHDYDTALNNIVSILKPGGYLQWDDFDGNLFSQTERERFNDGFIKLNQLVFDYFGAAGKCVRLSQMVKDRSAFADLCDIRRYEYSTLIHPELNQSAQDWAIQSYTTLTPGALRTLYPDLDEGEVAERSTALIEDLRRDIAAGMVPSPGIAVVVAQKPHNSIKL